MAKKKSVSDDSVDDGESKNVDAEPSATELKDALKLEKEVNAEIERVKEEMDANTDVYAMDPVRDYLRQIGQVDLLTHEQEKDFARRVEVGIYAEHKAETNTRISENTKKDLQALAQDGLKARNALIEANLRLVVSLSKRYSGHSMRFQDLIQEGNIGLIKAVEKYDYKTTFRFSTYATWWIRAAITRAMADHGRTIRVPVHMIELINKVNKITRQLEVQNGKIPSNKEISDKLGISMQKIAEAQKVAREPSSLYATLGDDGDTEFGDLIEDANAPDQLDVVSHKYKMDQFDLILNTLNPNERRVIEMQYGIWEQGSRASFADISRQIGISRERVRQIHKKTMSKLRHPSRSQLLRDYHQM
jgi:RNA polymerase primary sigma factor